MKQKNLLSIIEYFGSQSALAKAIGVTQQSISYWLKQESVPYEQSLKIIQATWGVFALYEGSSNKIELNSIIKKLGKLKQRKRRKIRQVDIEVGNSQKFRKTGDNMRNIDSKIVFNRSFYAYGQDIKYLGPHTFLLALYFQTSPHANSLGLYYLPIPYIAHDLDLDTGEILTALKDLQEVNFCIYDADTNYIWIQEMTAFYCTKCLRNNKQEIRKIRDYIKVLPKISFMSDFYASVKNLWSFEQSDRGVEG
jgi:hypothetical protein